MSQLIISNKYKSNNFDERKFQISFIILHYTETKTLKKAVELLTCSQKKVSCHFLINKDGSIFNLVNVYKRAWHAGVSQWKKLNDINSRSIGIEIVNSGELDKEKYSSKQLNSLTQLITELMEKFDIKEILGHSDIAPLRKIDPGVHFPWEQVYKNLGIIWMKDRCDNEKMNERDYINFLKKLREFGYPNLKISIDDKNNKLVINAFHRKYLPKYLYKKLSKTSLNKINDLLG